MFMLIAQLKNIKGKHTPSGNYNPKPETTQMPISKRTDLKTVYSMNYCSATENNRYL